MGSDEKLALLYALCAKKAGQNGHGGAAEGEVVSAAWAILILKNQAKPWILTQNPRKLGWIC